MDKGLQDYGKSYYFCIKKSFSSINKNILSIIIILAILHFYSGLPIKQIQLIRKCSVSKNKSQPSLNNMRNTLNHSSLQIRKISSILKRFGMKRETREINSRSQKRTLWTKKQNSKMSVIHRLINKAYECNVNHILKLFTFCI